MDKLESNMVEKFIDIISNLNEKGIEKIGIMMDIMDNFEEYNKNTTPERLAEIKTQRQQETEAYKIKIEQESFEKAKESYNNIQAKIGLLVGKDKKLFENLKKVSEMPEVRRNCLSYSELMLFDNIFNNNLMNGSSYLFLYGFMKGMKVEKLKSKSKAVKVA